MKRITGRLTACGNFIAGRDDRSATAAGTVLLSQLDAVLADGLPDVVPCMEESSDAPPDHDDDEDGLVEVIVEFDDDEGSPEKKTLLQ